jgi:hypothetical protein
MIFGMRLFGRVYVVPGVCHVATRFFHVSFVPLIPLGSWIVVSEDYSSWRGIKTRISLPSILMAWFRTALVFGLIIAIICAVSLGAMSHNSSMLAGFVGAALGFLIVRWLSYRFSKASPQKARQLVMALGVPQEAA